MAMAQARDLYKTKLCTLYQRGNCPRRSCSFAHGEAELRRFPDVGFNGRQERQDNRGDSRERLDRHGSASHRRRSPSRDGRGRPGNLSDRRFSPRDGGRSLSRSPGRRRFSRSYTPPRSASHKRESKKLRVEAPDAHLSDVSGDYYGRDNGRHPEDNKVKSSGVSPSPSPKDALQEQLRQVQLDNEALGEEKENLEKALGKKVEDASVLTSRNTELETKLSQAQEDCKRFNSRMKKLIKVYLRCTRAQEEVKKMQSKLQKMAEEFPMEENHRLNAHVDDSDYFNLSDGEPGRPANGIISQGTGAHLATIHFKLLDNGAERNGLSALNAPPATKGVDIEESLAIAKRKRLHSVREKTRASIRSMQQNGGNVRNSLENDPTISGPLQNSTASTMAGSENPSKVDMFLSLDAGSGKERWPGHDVSPSLQISPIDKVRGRDVRLDLPATGLAVHARDSHHGAAEELEEDRTNTVVDRERYKGDDEEVDRRGWSGS